MRRNTSPIRRQVEHNEHSTDGPCSDIEPIEDDPLPKATLHVQAPNRVVDGRQLRLDLDHEGDAAGRLQPKNVDRSTLAILGERDLDVDIPAQANELICHMADEGRVTFIEQPVDLSAAPRNQGVEAGVDRGERAPEDSDRKRREVSSLDQGNGLLRETGSGGEFPLAESAPTTERAKQPSDTHVVHASMVLKVTYPRRIREVSGTPSKDYPVVCLSA